MDNTQVLPYLENREWEVLRVETENYLGWRRPLRSWNPINRPSRQILSPGWGGSMNCRVYVHFWSNLEQTWHLSALPRVILGEGPSFSDSFSRLWRFSLVLLSPGLFPNHTLSKSASVTSFVCLFVCLSSSPAFWNLSLDHTNLPYGNICALGTFPRDV